MTYSERAERAVEHAGRKYNRAWAEGAPHLDELRRDWENALAFSEFAQFCDKIAREEAADAAALLGGERRTIARLVDSYGNMPDPAASAAGR
jgi:hypothetical protein